MLDSKDIAWVGPLPTTATTDATPVTFHGPQFGVSREALLAKARDERMAALCADDWFAQCAHEIRAKAFDEAAKL